MVKNPMNLLFKVVSFCLLTFLSAITHMGCADEPSMKDIRK